MKILKRIVYTLLGMLLAGTAVLVGVILYAEYTGNHFTQDSIPALTRTDFSDEESRLAYDENGNLLELPQTQSASDTNTAGSTAGSSGTVMDNLPAASAETTANHAESPAADTGASATDAASGSAAMDESAGNPVSTASYPPSATGAEPEIAYVMDLGSGLFHTPDCPYVSNIDDEKRSEMTTTSAKIMDAGYESCPHCHPDQVAAAAAAASLANTAAPSIDVSNELSP